MKFHLKEGGKIKTLPVFKGAEKIETANELYKFLKERDIFEGETGQIYSDLLPSGNNLILLGLGEAEKVNSESLRKAFFKLGRELMKFKIKSVEISLPILEKLSYSDTLRAAVEGLLQSEYSFEKYLTEKKITPCVKDVFFNTPKDKKREATHTIKETESLIKCVFFARDLVNEPASDMIPRALADIAKNELEGLGVKVKVYSKSGIKKLGMGAFLAVAEGSAQEPQLIVMDYQGNPDSDKKVALVGKGLTYDSGGYSIKPTKGMVTMFSDMGGAAAVVAAIRAIASEKLKKNVVGIIAACENLISSKAYKPGDILTSMSGKTIEVLNTDAEGRLTLADALWYASDKVKADTIIDVATLTGACEVALGNIYIGAIANDKTIMKAVKRASSVAGESVWELPNDERYRKLIKGNFADIKNTGGRGAGVITAGQFLEEFVNNTPWVHLDIAGTAYLSSKRDYLPKGATGVPVKTLYYFIKDFEL